MPPVQAQSDILDTDWVGNSESVILTDGSFQLEKLKLEIVVVESEFQKLNRLSEESLPAILKTIRQCESSGRVDAQNPRSTASGLYGYIDSTWANYGGYARAKLAPTYIQNQKALETFNSQGTTPWLASSKCWSSSRSKSNVQTVSSKSGANTCSCVLFVKQKYGIDPGSVGLARNWPINSRIAQAGAVVITRESSGYNSGHVGYVVSVNTDRGTITINDANFSQCKETTRELPINSPLIRGFFV